ncbi:hypothetical protein HDU82_002331 [Entophlyctis luteolus]|nr:hypothetical protein HDU82_002331 [Entophlyctis luteolus]
MDAPSPLVARPPRRAVPTPIRKPRSAQRLDALMTSMAEFLAHNDTNDSDYSGDAAELPRSPSRTPTPVSAAAPTPTDYTAPPAPPSTMPAAAPAPALRPLPPLPPALASRSRSVGGPQHHHQHQPHQQQQPHLRPRMHTHDVVSTTATAAAAVAPAAATPRRFDVDRATLLEARRVYNMQLAAAAAAAAATAASERPPPTPSPDADRRSASPASTRKPKNDNAAGFMARMKLDGLGMLQFGV